MIKKIFLSAIAVFSIVSSQAQTVKIQLSQFAGKEYTYTLAKGDKKDTIATGKLDKEGKTTLKLPASQKGYIGIAQFAINGAGSIDMIINNENFSVTCLEAEPNPDNIKYTGSPENDFLTGVQQPKNLIEKMGITQAALQVYKKEESLYTTFEKEKQQVEQQFAEQQTVITQSSLYAARIKEMTNFLMGQGSKPGLSQEELMKEYSPWVRNKLDMQAVYNSNLWSPIIENWTQMQLYGVKNDSILLSDTKAIVVRTKDNVVYTAFADKMSGLLTKAGKDDLVSSLGEYVSQSGRVEKPGNHLLSAMNGPVNGSIAPELQTATGKKVIKNKTLLFFYESGCNNCENEIHQLLGNYEVVKEKGFEIISVAADMTKNAGDGHGHEFPWKEQLCDYKGFQGVNFKNYGIIGTPTFFIIDEKGKITGRYARLIDTDILK